MRAQIGTVTFSQVCNLLEFEFTYVSIYCFCSQRKCHPRHLTKWWLLPGNLSCERIYFFSILYFKCLREYFIYVWIYIYPKMFDSQRIWKFGNFLWYTCLYQSVRSCCCFLVKPYCFLGSMYCVWGQLLLIGWRWKSGFPVQWRGWWVT